MLRLFEGEIAPRGRATPHVLRTCTFYPVLGDSDNSWMSVRAGPITFQLRRVGLPYNLIDQQILPS